jgi:hypothetical protein
MSGMVAFRDFEHWNASGGTWDSIFECVLVQINPATAPRAIREIEDALGTRVFLLFDDLPLAEKREVLRATRDAGAAFLRTPPDYAAGETEGAYWREKWTSLIAGMEKRTAEGEAAGEA